MKTTPVKLKSNSINTKPIGSDSLKKPLTKIGIDQDKLVRRIIVSSSNSNSEDSSSDDYSSDDGYEVPEGCEGGPDTVIFYLIITIP